jgi:hypothetical protein
MATAVSVSSFSQELSKKEQRKLEKQFKKEQKAEEAARKAELVHIMVQNRRFVLEADQLKDKRGNSVFVSSMINFVASDSVKGVIQIGSNDYVGRNGVGGITAEGPISNYESKYNEKNGTYTVTYNLVTPVGSYDVILIAFPDGKANATIGSAWPQKLNYFGYLVPPALSKVYKGSTL